MSELPEPYEVVTVTEKNLYRWNPYKPNSQQFKKGIKGRWQKLNEYGGWDNAKVEPINWEK